MVFKTAFKQILCGLMSLALITAAAGCADIDTPSPKPTGTQGAQSEKPAGDADNVSVMFINVGYGDAALVEIGTHRYLIDSGEATAAPMLLRALSLRGVQKLDGVFLTHTHSDHIGGMETLVCKYPVDTLYSAEISMPNKHGENKIEELANDLHLPHVKLSEGDTVKVTDGIAFEVIGPIVYNDEDDNDNSLILRLTVNGKTMLFTGDMQFDEEETLLKTDADVKADILKVGNHGNPDATSEVFAMAVSPEIAVISTSTEEDDDSANKRVRHALGMAQIAVTEDYVCGVLLTINPDGTVMIDDPLPEPFETTVTITSIDKETQTVTITAENDTDLSGFFLFSEKGGEIFVFPEGTKLNAGQSLTVACEGSEGDLIWDDDKVWSKKDVGALYDSGGNRLSRKKPE